MNVLFVAGFVVISCGDNTDSWCDVIDRDADLFPTMINFADRQETVAGYRESFVDLIYCSIVANQPTESNTRTFSSSVTGLLRGGWSVRTFSSVLRQQSHKFYRY